MEIVPTLRNENGVLYIDNGPLVENALGESYLTADIASGVGTITIRNISAFAVNLILLLEELGDENAEIVKTHASSAPSGSTVTLAANTVRAHTTGCKVRVIAYDQLELKHSVTETGSKTALTTTLGSGLVAIQADTVIQTWEETEFTTGYYFARYKDSIGGIFTGYTDAVVFGGWLANSVGYMIEQALYRCGITLGDKVTRKFCYDDGINECLRLVKGKLKRWPKHSIFNYLLGQVTYGTNEVALPSDIYDNTSVRSIMGVRIGTGEHLSYEDPEAFEDRFDGVSKTAVRTQASAAGTSLAVDNSYDFDDSGTLHVFVAGVRYDVTYTAVTRDTETGATAAFTGIPASGTGSITVTIPVDSVVLQGEVDGDPVVYTVRNGNIAFAPYADSSHLNQNIYLDYNTVATEVNSDGDLLDTERWDMVLDYLTWKIRSKSRDDGDLDLKDPYYTLFRERMNDAIRTSLPGTRSPMGPRLNRVSWRGGGRIR